MYIPIPILITILLVMLLVVVTCIVRRIARESYLSCFSSTRAADLIIKERIRQEQQEGFTTAYDDQFKKDELALAASCYLYCPQYPFSISSGQKAPNQWPMDPDSWKPKGGRLRQLIKAGALVLAEIEREQRKGSKVPANGSSVTDIKQHPYGNKKIGHRFAQGESFVKRPGNQA
jgi:hypothetical protein